MVLYLHIKKKSSKTLILLTGSGKLMSPLSLCFVTLEERRKPSKDSLTGLLFHTLFSLFEERMLLVLSLTNSDSHSPKPLLLNRNAEK